MIPLVDRALISDCGGLIQGLALVLPAAFFTQTDPQRNLFRPLTPIGNLLSSLPDDVEVHIFVDRTCLESAAAWMRNLDVRSSIELAPVSAAQNLITSPWIQDIVQVRTENGQGGERNELIAVPGNRLASEIARHFRWQMLISGQAIPGGNQLVGPQFRLIGASEVMSRRSTGRSEGFDRKRWDAVAAFDMRKLAVFGYRVADLNCDLEPGTFEMPLDSRGACASLTCLEDSVPFSFHSVHQCGFHVDQFVTVTGLVSDGRPLLVVADPLSVDGTRDRFNELIKRQLNASVLLLLQQGFAVVRNPIPMATAADTGKRVARLYNNVLLENACRPGRPHPLVWVPQFGDSEPLEVFDRQNLEVWRRLGFEPVPVQGWSHLAGRNGAIRCATKVLRRKNV